MFTESDMRRMIRAAIKEGLRVVGIRIDGTVILDDGKGPNPLIEPPKATDCDAVDDL